MTKDVLEGSILVESPIYKGTQYSLYRKGYEWGYFSYISVIIGREKFGTLHLSACNALLAKSYMEKHIDSLIAGGALIDQRAYEDAKLAAKTSATVLYNVLETFEQEVKVVLPVNLINAMVERNGKHLKTIYGKEILERITLEIAEQSKEATEEYLKLQTEAKE